MRKMKKIFSTGLALMLVLMLAVPAFAAPAANDGSITVNNPQDGQTYEAYQLFDLSLDGKNYGYTVNAQWKDFFTTGAGKDMVQIDQNNGNVTIVDGSADGLQKLAQAAKTYAEQNAGQVTKYTGTKAGNKVTFSNLPLGYYLVTTGTGALQALDTTNKNAVVYDKNVAPTIGKSADKTNAEYGETIHYTIPVTKGGYAWGAYVITDTMTGLDLKQNSITLKVNGQVVNTSDYTVESTTNTLKVTIPESTLNKRNADNTDFVYPAGTQFVLEYDAVAKRTISVDNKVSMEYHTDPNTTTTTPEYTVKVANYEFVVKKTDEQGNGLTATFQLYRDADCTQLMEFIHTGNNYRLAEVGEQASSGSERTSTITAGEATIQGLKAGTYYLKEIDAPAGYNKLVQPVKVEIIENRNTTTNSPYYGQAFDQDGNRIPPTIKMNDQNVTVSDGKFVLKVVNKTGTELPSTGGVGTTVFYVVGGLLMAAAVVVLVLKKRMQH